MDKVRRGHSLSETLLPASFHVVQDAGSQITRPLYLWQAPIALSSGRMKCVSALETRQRGDNSGRARRDHRNTMVVALCNQCPSRHTGDESMGAAPFMGGLATPSMHFLAL